MDRLRFLKLASNKLTGSLPATLGGLTSAKYVNLADNQLVGVGVWGCVGVRWCGGARRVCGGLRGWRRRGGGGGGGC